MYEFAITQPNKQLTDLFSEYKRLPLQLEKKLMFIYQGLVKYLSKSFSVTHKFRCVGRLSE